MFIFHADTNSIYTTMLMLDFLCKLNLFRRINEKKREIRLGLILEGSIFRFYYESGCNEVLELHLCELFAAVESENYCFARLSIHVFKVHSWKYGSSSAFITLCIHCLLL